MSLFGIGNPLLDIIVSVDDGFLAEFDLLANNAILAEAKHMPIYSRILNHKGVMHVAGGASQNTLRCAQWMLPAGSTFYVGATGVDEASKILAAKATSDGLKIHYLQIKDQSTGTCAVLLSKGGTARSLIANVAAAEHFSCDAFKSSPAYQAAIEAKVFYCSGFFLFSCPSAVREVATLARLRQKTFVFNLSATFVAASTTGPFGETLEAVLPMCDIVICNSDELLAFAGARKWENSAPIADLGAASSASDSSKQQMLELMKKFVSMDSSSQSDMPAPSKRTIVVTQGPGAVLVVERDVATNVHACHTFPVTVVPTTELVDTNGAGDAFAGGFVAQLLMGKSNVDCVNAGVWAAGQIIRVSGFVIPNVDVPASFA